MCEVHVCVFCFVFILFVLWMCSCFYSSLDLNLSLNHIPRFQFPNYLILRWEGTPLRHPAWVQLALTHHQIIPIEDGCTTQWSFDVLWFWCKSVVKCLVNEIWNSLYLQYPPPCNAFLMRTFILNFCIFHSQRRMKFGQRDMV